MKKIIFSLLMLAAALASAGAWEDAVGKAARLHKKGDLKGAEAILLNSLLDIEKNGESDPRLAYTLDYLGTLNMQMNEADKAAPMFERAVRAFSASRGPTAPETLESMGRLAESYDSLSKYALSEPLYRKIRDTGRGDGLLQSEDLNNLAVSIDAQGRQDEAMALYKQALALREQSVGPQGAELPEILNNMARVYYLKGDYKAAEPLYDRAISIDEAMLKPSDPQLADDYRRMAALYKKTGKADQAAACEAKASAVDAAAAAEASAPKPKVKSKMKTQEKAAP